MLGEGLRRHVVTPRLCSVMPCILCMLSPCCTVDSLYGVGACAAQVQRPACLHARLCCMSSHGDTQVRLNMEAIEDAFPIASGRGNASVHFES
jgi:hypothetical protein